MQHPRRPEDDDAAPSPGTGPSAEQGRRGRPRSQKSRVAVLTAATRLMTDSGFEQLTVEGIAVEAGVAKQTVYRWWGSKADVVVEAIAEGYLEIPIGGPEDTDELRADLSRWLLEITAATQLGDTSRLVQALLSALASASQTSEAINEALIQPIEQGLRERFTVHAQRHPGRLPAAPEFLADTVAATLLLHVMLGKPLGEDRVRQLLDLVAPVG